MISNTATGMGVDPSGDPIEVDSSSSRSDPYPDGEMYQHDSNPFISSTTVKFEVPFASQTVLAVYDVTGQESSRLADTFGQRINKVKMDH